MKHMTFMIKVLLILTVALLGYYFGYLKPHQAKLKEIGVHYSNLVENKNVYVALTKLNLDDPGFNDQKANLIAVIQETNRIGLAKVLNSKEKEIFTKQNDILVKVFATKSYQDGVAILKSEESTKLLTDETNLIGEFLHRLGRR